jgi:uncharacterized RDD family membrane protein YckC
MSEPFHPSSHRQITPAEQHAGDLAVSILRELDSHKTDEPEVASLVSRVLARSIDLILVFLVLSVGFSAVAVVRRIIIGSEAWSSTVSRPADIDPWLYVASVAALLVALVVYEVVATRGWEQTPGKRLLGIKIATGEDQPVPSRRMVIVRTLLWAVPFALVVTLPTAPVLGAVILVGIAAASIAMARNSEHRAYYDRLSGTRVVRPR